MNHLKISTIKSSSISKVFIITRNNFPNGDAGALRDHSFAKIYRALGFKVIIICNNPDIKIGIYDNFHFYSIYSKKKQKDIRSKINSEFGFKIRFKNLFNQFNFQLKDAIVHFPDLPFNMITYLKKNSPKANLKLVHDSVEWYSPKNFKFGLFSFGYFYKMFLNQVLISKSINVISISSFLQRFYTMKNIFSIRIPVILSKYLNLRLINSKFNPKKIKIIYAGSPARKDLLDDIIKATIIINEKNNNIIQLNIIGVNKSSSNDIYKSRNIIFHGIKKRSYILRHYKTANYSILIRPQNMIYSRAGFPTKIVESLSYSVPVITNLTSDLNLYLKNFQNSIICNSDSLEDIIKSLNLIMEIDYKKYLKLCYNAGLTYKKMFYYKNYLNEYKSFIVKSLKE